MDGATPWLLVAGGLLTLFLGGEFLVKGSASLALRLGLSPLVVGLTVVAFGTSSPELFVSIKAALREQGDIAVGNVIGSNIGNIGCILAVCAIIFPLRVAAQIIRFDMPVAVAAGLVLTVLLADGILVQAEAALLTVGIAAYLIAVVRLARRGNQTAVRNEYADSMPKPPRHPATDFLLIGGGLGLLALGARMLVGGATDIARTFGMSEAVIGLTVVAVGTSLPELSASLVAAFRRQGDIAVGNVVGSCIFNVFGILGVAGLVEPLYATGIRPLDIGVMVGFTVVLLPLMKTGFTLQRWEGFILLAAYIAYLSHLIQRGAPA